MNSKKKSDKKSGWNYAIKIDPYSVMVNQFFDRVDRALNIYEKISNIEAQSLEMEIRESMQRTITRGEQQSAMNKLLPLLASIGKPTLKTKGKKISAKDKRL